MKSSTSKPILLSFLIACVSCNDELAVQDEKVVLHSLDENINSLNNNDSYNLWQKSNNTQPRYDGSDSGPIDLALATAWMENFSVTAKWADSSSNYFDRKAIDDIFSQQGCTGTRFYYAITEKGEKKLLIAGVNNTGETILKHVVSSSFGATKSSRDSEPVALAVALAWVENYQKDIEPNEIRSHYFGRKIISKILSQDGCAGIRIFCAKTDEGESKLIIAGVDSYGDDMMPNSSGSRLVSDNVLADFSFPCPSVCPNQSKPPTGGL